MTDDCPPSAGLAYTHAPGQLGFGWSRWSLLALQFDDDDVWGVVSRVHHGTPEPPLRSPAERPTERPVERHLDLSLPLGSSLGTSSGLPC